MNNQFSISSIELVRLFNEERAKPIHALIEKYKQNFLPDEMHEQLVNKSGPVYLEAEKIWDEFGKKNINVEILTTIGLSYLYFGAEKETLISFEMKPSFRQNSVDSYIELSQNVTTDTYIDSAIESDNTKLLFQIKTYKEKYLKHTNNALLGYLKSEVLGGKYGPMSGTILVIIIQPQLANAITAFNFDTLTSEIKKFANQISFNKITISYTDATTNTATLHEIYPNNSRLEIPLDMMLAKFRGE